MPNEPYSAEEVVRICKKMWEQQGFAEWRARNAERKLLLSREKPVNIMGIAAMLEARSSVLEYHATLYDNYLDGADIEISVVARSDEKSALDAASSTEDFLNALFFDFKRRQSNRFFAPDRRRIGSATRYGCGLSRLSLVDDVRELLIKGDGNELLPPSFKSNPFRDETPDLNATAWEQDLSAFCEVGDKVVSAVMAAYPELKYENERLYFTSETMEEYVQANTYDTLCKVYHLETEEYIYDVVGSKDGEGALLLERTDNAAGRPNYSLVAGHIGPDREPYLMFRPLIGNLYPLVELENILGTLLMSGALETGRNMWQEVSDTRTGGDLLSIVQGAPEQVPVIRRDTSAATLPPPRAGHHWEPIDVPDQTQVRYALELVQQRIREMGFPEPISPSGSTDATSGHDRSVQQKPSSSFLEPPLRNIADAWKEKCILALEWLKEMDTPCSIPARQFSKGASLEFKKTVTIQPKDLQDVDIIVSFKSTDKAEQFAEQEADNRNLGLGLISVQTILAKRFPDWQAEYERIKRQRLEQQMDALAEQDTMTVVLDQRGEIMQQALNAAGVPLSDSELQPPQEGGGIDGQPRRERPEGGAMPNMGMPGTPPEQTQPDQIAPDAIGRGAEVTV